MTTSLQVQCSDKRYTLTLSAPVAQALEPRLVLENEAGQRVAQAALVLTSDGPANSVFVKAGESRVLLVTAGDLDLPMLSGLAARLLPVGVRAQRPGRLPRGRYRARVFSFSDGEPLAEAWLEVSSSESALVLADEALDDSAFVRGFLQEARALGDECFLKPGRWSAEELDEMAQYAELPSIPALHRELLLRVRRLGLADHDLVTPPMIEEDLENLSFQVEETALFPWFSIKPYDAGNYICIDLDTGGLVRVSYRDIESLKETPREYLRNLLQQASVR